jgi:hypothetical protein
VREVGPYKLLVYSLALVHSNEILEEPFSFEEAYVEHAWWDAMETGLRHIMDVITSCVNGYSDTSTTYINIPTQWEIVVSKDVIFEEDVRSSNSHDSP